jgi:hypothetical protein
MATGLPAAGGVKRKDAPAGAAVQPAAKAPRSTVRAAATAAGAGTPTQAALAALGASQGAGLTLSSLRLLLSSVGGTPAAGASAGIPALPAGGAQALGGAVNGTSGELASRTLAAAQLLLVQQQQQQQQQQPQLRAAQLTSLRQAMPAVVPAVNPGLKEEQHHQQQHGAAPAELRAVPTTAVLPHVLPAAAPSGSGAVGNGHADFEEQQAAAKAAQPPPELVAAGDAQARDQAGSGAGGVGGGAAAVPA